MSDPRGDLPAVPDPEALDAAIHADEARQEAAEAAIADEAGQSPFEL